MAKEANFLTVKLLDGIGTKPAVHVYVECMNVCMCTPLLITVCLDVLHLDTTIILVLAVPTSSTTI